MEETGLTGSPTAARSLATVLFTLSSFSGTGSNNLDLRTHGGTNSHAYAIKNAGVIVGNSQTAGIIVVNHTFIYGNWTMQDLNDRVVLGSSVTNIRLQDNARVPGERSAAKNNTTGVALVEACPSPDP